MGDPRRPLQVSAVEGAPEWQTLGPLFRDLVRRVLAVTLELPAESVHVAWDTDPTRQRRLLVCSTRDGPAGIAISLGEESPPEVTLEFGREAYLCLETDTYGVGPPEWPRFVASVVEAVVRGKFCETIKVKGAVVVSSTFEIELSGKPFRFKRTSLPNYLRHLMAPTNTTQLRYRPFV
jgi:hypothetical protein